MAALGKLMLAAAACICFTVAPAFSYKLNPLRDRNQGGEVPRHAAETDPVHENITYAALACLNMMQAARALQPLLCPMATRERRATDPGNLTNALIVGVWWNDDPNQWLYAGDVISFGLVHRNAENTAKLVRETGAASQSASSSIHFRSHFGDLQFLHAMATRDGQNAVETRGKIVSWMRFAYQVATGAIAPDTRLRDVSETRELFLNRGAWPVERLFKPRMRMRHLSLSELALGSMLHTVQDSYAEGHSLRSFDASPQCRSGRVKQFHSYSNQSGGLHLSADMTDALHRSSNERFTPLQNPVEASARLILMARQKADWDTVVKPFLLSDVFCLDTDTEVSGPGKFASTAYIRARALELARSIDCGGAPGVPGIRRKLIAEGLSPVEVNNVLSVPSTIYEVNVACSSGTQRRVT